MMISKKLLGSVLGIEVDEVQFVEPSTVLYNDHFVIDTDKLMSKCKKWANTKNYAIETTVFDNGVSVVLWDHCLINSLWSLNNVLSESEAVFKACEWILEKETE